jgi:hypothetical protein
LALNHQWKICCHMYTKASILSVRDKGQASSTMGKCALRWSCTCEGVCYVLGMSHTEWYRWHRVTFQRYKKIWMEPRSKMNLYWGECNE